MCIAIAKPKNILIYKETFETCFAANSDGAGFAYSDRGSMVIEKGFFTFDEFFKAYEPHANKTCLIHFRIKTHGKLSQENCHPFSVTDTLAFIHNGIINSHGYDAHKSDTVDFNEKVLIPLVAKYGEEVLNSDLIKPLIESYIGGSKLVFMDGITEEFTIYNESLGNWNSGVWFSNTSWKKFTPPVYPKYNSGQFKKKNSWNETAPLASVPFVLREVDTLTKYVNSQAHVIEKESYVKAVSNVFSSEGTQILEMGDLYLIEKLYSNHRVDVYNPLSNMRSNDIPLYHLFPVKDEDLTTFFGV